MRHAVAIVTFCAFSAAATGTYAQSAPATAPPRFEVWAGISGVFPGNLGTLVSSYSPPLLLDGDFTSHGAQTLVLDSGWHAGFEAGANVFFVPAAGIQVTYDWDSSALSGVNGPYDLTLEYTSRPPPNNTPIPVSIQQSTPWPDTMGTITRNTWNVNGVARFGRPDHVSATLSGGLSIHHVAGTVQPVAYNTFHLGGHSVLFGDAYQLAVSLEPTQAIGFNVGGDVNVGLGPALALTAGYRYMGGPGVDVPARDVSILNPDQIFFTQTTAEIKQQLALPPVHLTLGSSRVFAGLKVFF